MKFGTKEITRKSELWIQKEVFVVKKSRFEWLNLLIDKLKNRIEECAREVLKVRDKFKNERLTSLYARVSAPPELTKAHQKLDKAVDEAYRKGGFKDDAERIKYLFTQYQDITKNSSGKV